MSLLSLPKAREPAGLLVETGTPYSQLRTTELYPLLTEASVDVSRNKAIEARLVFESRRNPDGSWEVQDSGVFDRWTPLRLLVTFGVLRQEEVFRGFVRELKATHPDNPGESTVTVVAQDHSLAADRDHRRRVWGAEVPTSDTVILSEVLARYRLTPDPANGQGLSGIEVNQDATDAAFLRSRAEANGYDLMYERGTVYFGPQRLGSPEQDPILVAAGPDTNCVELGIETDARKPDAVVAEFTVGQGGTGTTREIRVEPDQRLLGTTPLRSDAVGLGENVERMQGQGDDEEAIRRSAQAKVNELSMKTTATGVLDGTAYGHVLLAGRTVRVDGVGPTNAGSYFVDTVTHTFTAEGYRQRFQLLRNAVGDDGLGALGAAPGSLTALLS